MKNYFRIEITSVPDREKVVAEIWFGVDMIAEIMQESSLPKIDFYEISKSVYDLQDLLNILEEAKSKLLFK